MASQGKYKALLSAIKIVIPLLLISCYSNSMDALAPVLRNMQEAFPSASLTLVQMTITLPSAVSVPIQLLTIPLSQFMSKKDMMVIAILFICVGGLIPLVFHSSIIYVVISSVIIGIGQGFFMPASNAIIAELFDGNARGELMGIRTGVSGFMRSLLLLASGFFGALYWYRSYLIFVIMIPFIILFIIATPQGPKGAKLVGKGVGLSGFKGMLTGGFIFITIISFFATVNQMAFLTNIAGYIADRNFGGAVTAGTATASNTMARLFCGIFFGFLLKVFKKYLLPIGYAMNAVGYLIILKANGIVGVQIGGILFGIGLGIQMAGGTYYLSEEVEKRYMGQAMGLYMPVISFAVSVSPVIINFLSGTVLGGTTATNNFRVGFYGYMLVAIALFIYEIVFCKNSMIGKISGLEGEAEKPAETKE